MVLCHRGKSLGPPPDLKVGGLMDVVGRTWAYAGDSEDGRGAVFVVHEEKVDDHLPSCGPLRLPTPAFAVKDQRETVATTYYYRQDLRVVRYDYVEGGKKDFSAQFFSGDTWRSSAGPEIWPFYGSIGANSSNFIIEVEGEKCVDVLRANGIAAITHPGHQRDEASCRARYAGLAAAGIKKVCFISDNDVAGRRKAVAFSAAAQLAKIEFCVIPAESIYDVPDGGSVDDMPAENLSFLITAAIKSASGVKPAPLNRISYGKIKQDLQDFYETEPTGAANIQAAIADIASANNASVFDTKRIWDSLSEDRQATSEALSATSAIFQRRELETKRESVNLSDYLPESICGAVAELTRNLACDPLIAASVVLTTAAGVFQAGHRLDAGDGMFVKQPVIWLLLAGPSGSGKSPIMRQLCKDRLSLVLSHYDFLSKSEKAEYDMRYLGVAKGARPEEPKPLETCVENFTTESLTEILVDNHAKGLSTFIYSEEIKRVLGNFDEYKSHGKGSGKETFLCLFDGNVPSSLRIGRRLRGNSGKVQNSLLGGVQPGVFRTMVEYGDDAGLFARCLVVPLINKYIEPNFFRSPDEVTAVHMAGQCLESFYLRCLGLRPLVLRLEREAVELFTILSRDTYDKSQAVSLESQRAVFGKRLGYVLQVALTMHLCRVVAGEERGDELFLSRQTLARATVLVDLLQSYAVLEQQESQMTRHGSFDLNRRIHTYAKGVNGCSASVFVSQCVPARYRKEILPTHVKAAMAQLVDMGLGEWRREGRAAVFVALGRFPD